MGRLSWDDMATVTFVCVDAMGCKYIAVSVVSDALTLYARLSCDLFTMF